MNDSTKGSLLIVLLVSLLALSSGTVFGVNHIGEDISKQIIPTSLTETPNTINTIEENSFEAKNISIKTSENTTNSTMNITNNTDNNTTNTTNIFENNTNLNNNENTTNNYNNTSDVTNNTTYEDTSYFEKFIEETF